MKTFLRNLPLLALLFIGGLRCQPALGQTTTTPLPACFQSWQPASVPIAWQTNVVSVLQTNVVSVPDTNAMNDRAVDLARDPADPRFMLITCAVPSNQAWRIEARLPEVADDGWFTLPSSAQSGGVVRARLGTRAHPYPVQFRAHRVR